METELKAAAIIEFLTKLPLNHKEMVKSGQFRIDFKEFLVTPEELDQLENVCLALDLNLRLSVGMGAKSGTLYTLCTVSSKPYLDGI